MTIPISTPQIQPSLAPPQPSIIEQVAPILEQLTRQKIAQAQIADYQSLADERKAAIAKQARDLQDQADAAKAFYDHLSGAAVRLKPEKPSAEGIPSHQGVDNTTGTLIPLPQFERGLNPGALVHYHQLVEDYNKTVLQRQSEVSGKATAAHDQALAELTNLQATEARRRADDEANVQRILAQSDLTTLNGQRQAIGAVLRTAGPDQADKIANALNVGSGRFHPLIGPDGYMYIVDTKLGTSRKDTTVGQREGIGQVRLEAIRRSAGTIVDLLDAQQQIIQGAGIQGSKNPVVAQMLQDARALGISTEAAANLFRSDPQQATQMLKTRFVHNYIGLLANARSSGPLLQNLGESYWPVGVSDAVLQRANRDRQKLRAIMVGVRDGKITDLNQIPGFSASMAAAAAEGQNVPTTGGTTPTGQPNPDNFYRPP